MRPTNHSTSTFVLLSVLGLFGGWAVGAQTAIQAESAARPVESTSQAADSLLLDQHPNARAAYSLRKLRSDYSGPVVRVRRGSDGAEQDFGFAENNKLNVSALENWLSGADGFVIRWYSQVSGEPDLEQTDTSDQPYIAKSGTVTTDSDGRAAIKFSRSQGTYLTLPSPLSSFQVENSMPYMVGERLTSDNQGILSLANEGGLAANKFRIKGHHNGIEAHRIRDGVDGGWGASLGNPMFKAVNYNTANSSRKVFGNNAVKSSSPISGSATASGLTIGRFASGSEHYEGYMTEVAVMPGQETESGVQAIYDNVNASWSLGPEGYHPDALLPQAEAWQVSLYDWLETISESDVALNTSGTLQYDPGALSEDELADLWLKVEGLSASSVTRREAKWYVLDNGNGEGIEATGTVRANHEPYGPGDYGGNPPRSWQNEPAYWYKTDIPLSGDGQGNPWYQDENVGRRAMVVSTVDLVMHAENLSQSSGWFDMVGKAFLGMAQAYRWAGDVMSGQAQDSYEKGMEKILDHLIDRGPRAVNTNMDMFTLNGAIHFYMATDNATRQNKCVQLVKDALFGFKDGELETNHEVFKTEGNDGGVFDPSGFIMEGDQPDVFYGGESQFHLTAALAAATDRTTGDIDPNWQFLEEVVRRLQEWRSYQKFYDPAVKSPAVGGGYATTFVTAGAGFSGRTSYGVPNSQASSTWKDHVIADNFSEFANVAKGQLPDVSDLKSKISDRLSTMDERMSSTYGGTANKWEGWSPWTKHTAYLPPEGWYSRLKSLKQNNDSQFSSPVPARDGNTFNKTLGGPPTGNQYWSYKDTDANGEEWGFFVEAQAQQGGYGGWYGGKIETFWTESTGVVLLNRHGKGGCDRSGVDDYSGSEDSACWFNLDEKAGHHVWGRDENGNGFTTLLLRGHDLQRTSTFNTDGSPPTVTVNNVFNDPNGMQSNGGEETGSELQESVEVENKFEVQTGGLKVTHTITSDETDEVNELWASLPVYLRHFNPKRGGDQLQSGLEDTKIDYWDGAQWVELPYDTDADEVPEIVTTGALQLTRDYEGHAGNGGPAHAYVQFSSDQDVRRSKHKYYDPYQSRTSVRTVHIDLHGNPGTTKTLPASKSVSYTIQTTDPTSEDTSTSQALPLQKGWNVASTSVSPAVPDIDSVFSGLQSEIMVVENEAGERYRPGENVDEIGQWNSEEAYRIYAASDVILTIQGDSLGSPSITLDEGWNLVPYFPSTVLSVEEALSSIVEDLSLVKDERGRAYMPEKDPDALTQMEPGEGYKIYVQQSTTLNYPDGSN